MAVCGRQWVGFQCLLHSVASPETSSSLWRLSSRVGYYLFPESFQLLSSSGLQVVCFSQHHPLCSRPPIFLCFISIFLVPSLFKLFTFFMPPAQSLSPSCESSPMCCMGLYLIAALLSERCWLSSLRYVQAGSVSRAIYTTQVCSCTGMCCNSVLEMLCVTTTLLHWGKMWACDKLIRVQNKLLSVVLGGGLNPGEFIYLIHCAVPWIDVSAELYCETAEH